MSSAVSDIDFLAIMSHNLDLLLRSLVFSPTLRIRVGSIDFLRDKLTQIDGKATRTEKAEQLLTILSTVTDREEQQLVFDKLLVALREDGQEHVANIFRPNSVARPMSEAHYQLIQEKQEELCQFLDPSCDLLNKLITASVITRRDMDSVRSKAMYNEMALELVNILLCKPDIAFDKFIGALSNAGQQHVVHILTGQGESPLSRLRRLVLKKARYRLVNRLDAVHTSLLDILISESVLTDDDTQGIIAHSVSEDRTAQLIDVMARKSQLADNKFILALNDSGHHEIADTLVGLELKGQIDPRFLSDTTPGEKNVIVRIVMNKIKALVTGTEGNIGAITSLMEQNGFAVSDVSEGSIRISFRCFTEESLINLKRLYLNGTLDNLFTQTFCPNFTKQGLVSLALSIKEDEFDRGAETLKHMFVRHLKTSHETAVQCVADDLHGDKKAKTTQFNSRSKNSNKSNSERGVIDPVRQQLLSKTMRGTAVNSELVQVGLKTYRRLPVPAVSVGPPPKPRTKPTAMDFNSLKTQFTTA